MKRMKIIITLCVSVLFILAVCGGCAISQPGNQTANMEPPDAPAAVPPGFAPSAPEMAPQLDALLTTGSSPEQRVRAIQLATSWMFVDEDGNCSGIESDSPHALQLHPSEFAEVTLQLVDGNNNNIELHFSDNYPPESVSAQRWDTEYARSDQDAGAQDIDEALGKSEAVELDGSAIIVSDDGHDYIYFVHAVWPNGNSNYAFRTESASNP